MDDRVIYNPVKPYFCKGHLHQLQIAVTGIYTAVPIPAPLNLIA